MKDPVLWVSLVNSESSRDRSWLTQSSRRQQRHWSFVSGGIRSICRKAKDLHIGTVGPPGSIIKQWLILIRNETTANEVLSAARASNPGTETYFIKTDATLLSSVRDACLQIMQREKSINLLMFTCGGFSMTGREGRSLRSNTSWIKIKYIVMDSSNTLWTHDH